MNRVVRVLMGTLVGLALVAGVVWAAEAGAIQLAPHTAPMKALADGSYGSGWVEIDPGEVLTFTHNLTGTADTYGVDLWLLDSTAGGYGINTRAIGGMDVAGQRYGAYWSHLTDSSIRVTRNAADTNADLVRVRVWQIDPPDWDSGWVDIETGESNILTLTHELGGNVDDYQVGIRFRDVQTNGLGTHIFAVGGMESAGIFLGAAWLNLTDTTIQALRFSGDETADQVRLTISRSGTPPDFDSGWVNVTQGQTEVISHTLGGNLNSYVVRGSQRSALHTYGVNSMGAGMFEIEFGGGNLYRGAFLQNLTDSVIGVHRAQNDIFADEVRVRIWAPKTAYLPIVMQNAGTSTELAYDDGSAESNQSHDLGNGFAVRFTLPAASGSVQRASFYLLAATGTHPIEVHVWNEAHTDLITPFQVTPPAGDGWYDVDLSTYSLTVTSDFYVGFLYAGTESHYDPSLGVDTDNPAGRSYEVPWAAVTNNYMIRTVVQGGP